MAALMWRTGDLRSLPLRRHKRARVIRRLLTKIGDHSRLYTATTGQESTSLGLFEATRPFAKNRLGHLDPFIEELRDVFPGMIKYVFRSERLNSSSMPSLKLQISAASGLHKNTVDGRKLKKPLNWWSRARPVGRAFLARDD